MQPEQATFLLATLLPALKNEHRLTRNVIAAIPFDKADYRPDPSSRSAMDLAWHIAGSEKRFLDAVASGQFDLTPSPRPDSIRNSADLVAWLDQSFERSSQRLTQLSPDQLLKVIDFRGIFQLPAVRFIQISLNHTIHHRGQLSTYLRPMGAKVPSIYGESYDDAQARLAAQAQSTSA